MSTTVIHVLLDLSPATRPAKPLVRLMVNSRELKIMAKPVAGAKDLYVGTARLPTCAEVAIAQAGLVVKEDSLRTAAGMKGHTVMDSRSYAFSLMFNAVIFIRWKGHFEKFSLDYGYHAFILSNNPERHAALQVVGSTKDLGKWNPENVKAKTMHLKKDLSLTAISSVGEELEFNLIHGKEGTFTWEKLDKPKKKFSPLRNDVFIYSTWNQAHTTITFPPSRSLKEGIKERSHIVFHINDCSTQFRLRAEEVIMRGAECKRGLLNHTEGQKDRGEEAQAPPEGDAKATAKKHEHLVSSGEGALCNLKPEEPPQLATDVTPRRNDNLVNTLICGEGKHPDLKTSESFMKGDLDVTPRRSENLVNTLVSEEDAPPIDEELNLDEDKLDEAGPTKKHGSFCCAKRHVQHLIHKYRKPNAIRS